MLEYNGNIHQICCWFQESLGYEFIIFHRPAIIMKDFTILSRQIDPLIHQYMVTTCTIRSNDFRSRHFSHDVDSFLICSNPCLNWASDVQLLSTISLSTPCTLQFLHIRFIQNLFLFHSSTLLFTTLIRFISPEEIMYIIFLSRLRIPLIISLILDHAI